jgi:nucleotide-binding universal stress UspA family protein
LFRIKRILYPTDFSPYSNQAYFHAVGLAELHAAKLTVMYVFNRKSDPQGDPAYWRGQLEQIRPANHAIAVEHILLEGDPGEVIPRYVADAGIDMVVMGTHGRTGQERLLMGSVAEQTLRSAPCSVLVVKLPKRIATDVRADAGQSSPSHQVLSRSGAAVKAD